LKKGIFSCLRSYSGTQIGPSLYFSPFFLSPLPIVISTGLKILYSPLY
jgi:hypothetical protein